MLGFLVGGVALLAAFVLVERRSADPLVPMRLFRSRSLATSGVALGLNGAAFLSMFFLTAIYLQQARGDSALEAGLHFLPMGGAAIVAAVVAGQLVTRVGTRPVQLGGAVLSVAGLLMLTLVGTDDAYTTGLLPGLLLFGAGIIAVSVPAQIAAVSEVENHEAGAASGLVSAVYQIGGALGLAVVTTLSLTHVTGQLDAGVGPQQALVDGFHRGILVAAAFAVVNIAVSLATPRLTPNAEQLAEAAATA